MRAGKCAAIQNPKAESLSTHPLGQAIDGLLNLDIPAKGRIAHHIRTGRLHRALGLCAYGQTVLWRNVWKHAAPAMLDQVRRLGQVEQLIRNTVNHKNPESLGGMY